MVSIHSRMSILFNGPFVVHQLMNLQTLALRIGGWLEEDDLGKLTQLRRLEVRGNIMKHLMERFSQSLLKLTTLRTLKLMAHQGQTFIPELLPFSHHPYLDKVFLGGKLQKFPDGIEFYPPNLIKLDLQWSKLEKDPMATLENLPNLRILRLYHNSQVGKKMVCSSGGLLHLEFLKLSCLDELEELMVEEGAMPWLRKLEIGFCLQMKKLPHGLLQLKNLLELKLVSLSHELLNQVHQTERGD